MDIRFFVFLLSEKSLFWSEDFYYLGWLGNNGILMDMVYIYYLSFIYHFINLYNELAKNTI